MRPRAIALALLLSSTSFLVLAPQVSAAGNGDDLVVAAVQQTPGNPCQQQGFLGGMAVQENGANLTRLYVAVQDNHTVGIVGTKMVSGLFPCVGNITMNTGGPGFNALGYDASGLHGTIRFWGALNATSTVKGFDASGNVVVTFTHNQPGTIKGLAVETRQGHLFVGVQGQGTMGEYNVSSAGVVTYLGNVPVQQAINTITPWAGALLLADFSYTVRNILPDGTPLGMAASPGWNYTDPWYQIYRASYDFSHMAYDAATFASSAKGALWIGHTVNYPVCVLQCNPTIVCILFEGTTCLQ
ncbi:MAG: hypothetical protein LC624_02300, partial [Halobacteriales archaeon]|nr:hypothetical protein [Halobacteriales archaeon]